MLRHLYEAFNRGDSAYICRRLDPDVEVHEAPEMPGGGTYRGPDAALKLLEDRRTTFEDLQVEPQRFIEVGEQIAVIYRVSGKARGSDVPIQTEAAHVFKVREGRVVELRAYFDGKQALKALEGRK